MLFRSTLATPHQADDTDATLPFRGALKYAFPRERLAAMRQRARGLGATLNDLLITEFFLAIDRWNRDYGSGTQRVRVSMPVNLREGALRLPAANIVSMCFLNRSPKVLRDPRALLDSVRKETAYIRKHRMRLTLVRSIRSEEHTSELQSH